MPEGSTPGRRVTIVDVARHAGVSTSAVSKVVRNAYGTSPAMRTRVRAAIEELGYRPSAAARALRGRTYTIGVMLPDFRNPFFADVIEHLADTEYRLLLAWSCDDAASEDRVTDAMIDRGTPTSPSPRSARCRSPPWTRPATRSAPPRPGCCWTASPTGPVRRCG